MARGEPRRSLLPSQRGRVAQQLRLCKQTTAHGRVLADKLLEGDGGTLVEAVRGVPLIKAKTTWDSGFLHSFMEVHAFFSSEYAGSSCLRALSVFERQTGVNKITYAGAHGR